MKIVELNEKLEYVPFRDLKPGDVFRYDKDSSGTAWMKVFGPGRGFNSIDLQTGQMCRSSDGIEYYKLDATLTVKPKVKA